MDLIADRKIETAIIGIALTFPHAQAEIAGLDNSLFAFTDTQTAHKAMQAMVEAKQPIDLITLDAELEKSCTTSQTAFLMECSSGAYTSTNLGTYEARLMELRQRRNLSLTAQNIMQRVSDPNTSVDTLCEMARASAEMVGEEKLTTSSAEALLAFIERLNKAKVGRRFSGMEYLDKITGGFRGGQMIVIAARPAVGKSALATQIAVNIAEHYKGDDGREGHVLFVSLEMGEDEITSRIVANIAGIDSSLLETGEADADALVRAAECYGYISQLPMHYSTRASTPLQIRRIASKLKAKHELAAIVVDYLQLMHSDSKCGNRNEEVGEVSRALKALAMDLQVPVFALCQFNRQSEQGNGNATKRKPNMSEARESGSIEQDADKFLTLWQPAEPTDTSSPMFSAYHTCQANGHELLCISIDKNRGGRTGNVLTAFDKPHLRFTCIDTKN